MLWQFFSLPGIENGIEYRYFSRYRIEVRNSSIVTTLPWTATPFSNDPLWLTLFVEGVNDRLMDHCQVSSVPHYCSFKEQKIPTMYTVWMVIYWNSNVNILIFWDTGFWLSLAVSSNHQNENKTTFEEFYFTCNESKIYESFTFWNKLQDFFFFLPYSFFF